MSTWQARHRGARCGPDRFGKAGRGGARQAGFAMFRPGQVRLGVERCGRQGSAGIGWSGCRRSRLGPVGLGRLGIGTSSLGPAGFGRVRQAWHGSSRQGQVELGASLYGLAGAA